MPHASDFLESSVLEHIFRTNTMAKPVTLAIALATGTLDDSMGGTLGNLEVANAGSYARQILAPGNANWDFTPNAQAGSGNVSNASQISFPQATANWGTITHVAILNSGVYASGNMLYHGPLTVQKTVTTGDTFRFNVGDLDVFMG